MSNDLERRFTAGEVRVDQAETSLLPVIRGYAIVTGVLSEDLGGFREIIEPTALQRTLRDGVDLRALFNHDTSSVLGRQSAGTLRVRAEPRGLAVEIDPPDTTVGRDVIVSLRRRDITGMSFAFRTKEDGQWVTWDFKSNPPIRHIHEMVYTEVSIVATPAYPDTSVAVRALREYTGGSSRSVEMLRREQKQRTALWR